MRELFLIVLNRSIQASYVILFVILFRLLLKKSPKVISYALWGVAAFRLVIPFSFESMFSLMPRNTNITPISNVITEQQGSQLDRGIGEIEAFVTRSFHPATIDTSANPLQAYIDIGTIIWMIGIIILLGYSIISFIILKRQLRRVSITEGNIVES